MTSAGRAGPLVLLLPILGCALGVVYLRGRVPRGGSAPSANPFVEPAEGAPSVSGLVGSARAPDGSLLRVALTPVCAWPARRTLYDAGLRNQLGLEPGGAWRLEFSRHDTDQVQGDAVPLTLQGASVQDAQGTALGPFESERGGALAALFGQDSARLLVGQRARLFLWGREPGAGARLSLGASCKPELLIELRPAELPGGATALVVVSEPTTQGQARGSELAREKSEQATRDAGAEAAGEPDSAVLALTAKVTWLERELRQERTRRQERELEWYDFNRALSDLGLDRTTGVSPFPMQQGRTPEPVEALDGPDEEADEEPDGEQQAQLARSAERMLALRTLLRREAVLGLDLLEVGVLAAGATGPVLFRLLDDRGRLTGHLYAARLRLEASRAARLLTLVLEQGYESHGGARMHFTRGTRRIVLPFVDPTPWLVSMPELFSAGDLRPPQDDGRWQLEALRGRINALLSTNTALGWYRLRALGGVFAGELMDVHVEAFTAEGRIERHLFADRLRIVAESPGVMFELEDGASMRGDEKTVFLNGRHRIFLPRADLEEWRAARVPGLAISSGAAPAAVDDGSEDGEPAGP